MVKLKDLDKYDTLLDVQPSDTSDKEYQIRWSKDYGYFCECIGWQSSKKKPRMCKHLKRFLFKQEIERTTWEILCSKDKKEQANDILNLAKEIWRGQI